MDKVSPVLSSTKLVVFSIYISYFLFCCCCPIIIVRHCLLLLVKQWEPMRQLQETCNKCNLKMSWWHDQGSSLFGTPWTCVLLIGSKAIRWGHGTTELEAKENAAKRAIKRLLMNHLSYDEVSNNVTIGEKIRWHTLSTWRREDRCDSILSTSYIDRLIDRHLH